MYAKNIIKNNVTITGNTTLAGNNVIFPNAIVGSEPQDLKYYGEQTKLIIAEDLFKAFYQRKTFQLLSPVHQNLQQLEYSFRMETAFCMLTSEIFYP